MWGEEFKRFTQYLMRALQLKCPVCGEKPIFIPWRQVRHLRDWVMPLDGCPNCGYPYHRDSGYYLLTTWIVNFAFALALGLTLYFLNDWHLQVPLVALLIGVAVPVLIFNFLFLRHSKAIFLAVDLYFDPHDRGDDGGGDEAPEEPDPASGSPGETPDLPCGGPLILR